MKHYEKGGHIIYKNKFVLSCNYSEYNNEKNNLYKSINKKHYHFMWHEKTIYL